MSRLNKKKPGRARLYAILALLGLAAGGAAAIYAIETVGMTPRQVGPYIERRSGGHNALIEGVSRRVASTLAVLDRGDGTAPVLPAWHAGARPAGPGTASGAHIVPVASPGALVQAMAQARPGDVITLQPGTYRFSGTPYIVAALPGTKEQPITVRAERPGSVTIESQLAEGFLVSAPYWTFENLTIRGACSDPGACEHAFHVTGRASGFVSRNNTISDFNSHFKVNAQNGHAPDAGVIEHNTLSNAAVRQTSSPVTPIDLVAGSGWSLRANLIYDFIKGQGDQVSYGGYAKGAGSANVFARNVVICEQRLRGHPGQRVGLSLGGGGTGLPYCRDRRCITEQDGSTIESNLIASCSDEGIYLNRAATSKVLHNTLIDTAGIMVRYVETSATIAGNIVDGRVRADRGAILRAGDNLETGLSRLYAGFHPQRALFQDPLALNLAWSGEAPRRARGEPDVGIDLCGASRPAQPAYGAVENFAACLQR
ncbi:right-handed parallel beta-helix repeat-containing protein [Pseudoduganella sp. LjRoot289]|uniref:chondroitinase-B domain-containing protein n=1 Tax=Pseudoduganella sp. LjRoot289 TaxID=3342314 RepID=UPI003ECD893F